MGEVGELLSAADEWADVAPAEYPIDGRAVMDIQYSEEYEDAFGLLYACVAAGETSERVLKLTEKCITLSPSHYTAWHWRFRVRPNSQRGRSDHIVPVQKPVSTVLAFHGL
jgi:protein farnesyltransferase/geranylgeranyltransferase type-1 subunit alpha